MKKRFLSLLMALILVMSMFSAVTVGAYAKDVSMEVVTNEDNDDYDDWEDPFEDAVLSEDGLYYYSLEDSKATIVYCMADELPTSFTVPETIDGYPVIAIAEDAFMGLFGMNSLTIPDCIEDIGTNAFYFTDVQVLNIGSGVKTIGDAAFAGCSGLDKINVDEANANFTAVNDVLYTKDMKTLIQYPTAKDAIEFEIPSTVTKIGNSAFESSNLESIVIPSNVIEIDSYAFFECFSLEEVILNENLQRIGEGAFEFANIETITIPASVTSIEVCVFDDITCLKEINVNSANENYCSVNGILFSKDMKEFIKYPEGKTATTYTIPDSVETLKEYSFNFVTLESITIPDTVVNFEEDVFFGSEEITIICSKNSKAAEYAEEYYLNVKYTDVVLATSLKLNATTIKWPVGKSGSFKPTVLPAEASQKLEWTSSNPAVAKVDANGKLTAVSVGTATITCKTTDGSNLSATCKVTVGPLVSSLKLNATTINWPVGKSGSFKPTVAPSNAVNTKLSWTSSNSKVATVDANGKLTAVAEGTAVITCKTTDGSNLSATCRVTVKENIASSLKLNANFINWSIGKSGYFKPTVLPAECASQKLEWTSSNPNVAIVNANGKLTAVGVGTTTITCKTTDGSNLKATCTVTIGKLVTSVKLNATTINWSVGKSGSFKPTVSPSNAANKTLSWTSSNTNVATVSASGKLTAKAPGTTTITCKATDGSGKYATCKVTVTAVKVSSIKLNASSIVWEVGKSGSFKPTVSPSNATNKTLKWESLNPNVATITSAGKLTAKAPGTAKIVCKATDGSGVVAYCQVLVTESGKPTNYTNFFKSYVKDGTYAINGTIDYIDEYDEYLYTSDIQLGVTAKQCYLYELEETGSIKTFSGPDGSYIILYDIKLSDGFTLSEAKELGFPTQYFYSTKDYFTKIDDTPLETVLLENLTYKSSGTEKIDGVTYTKEIFSGEEQDSEVTFYFNGGKLCYLDMYSDGIQFSIKVTSIQGTFKYSDYKVPSGSVEIDADVWGCLL